MAEREGERRDRLFEALFFATDHWAQLGAAVAWEKAATLLEPVDPGAAGVAWGYAARSYGIYVDAYREAGAASRWDYGYGAELQAAEAKAGALRGRTPAATFPHWARMILERDFEVAFRELRIRPDAPAERALVGVLAIACHHADRKEDAQRLTEWAARH